MRIGAESRPGTSVEASEGEYILSLGDLLQVVWKRLWVIVLVPVLLVGAAVGFSLLQTPMYEASIKILVGQEQRTDAPSNLGSDVQGLQQVTQTMAEAVNSRPIAEAVIDRQNLRMDPEDFLKEDLTVEQVGATQFIEVSYTDTDPVRAQEVANSVGEVFSEQVSEVSASTNAITATVWEEAELPDEPVSPNLLLYAGVAVAAGLALGLGLAFLLEYLDDSWRSPEEVEQISGVPNFGVVPEFKVLDGKALKRQKGEPGNGIPLSPESGDPSSRRENRAGDLPGRLVATLDPTGIATEAYRTLRTNLIYATVDDPPKVVVVTSVGPREGKSTTCANLAEVLAQAGKRTLLIDCDLRRPVLHKIFELRNLRGIVNMLAGEKDLPEVWQEPLANLKVVTVGSLPPNPAELLGSRRFVELLDRTREAFDYVLLDAPPLGLVSDPAILATLSDGVLLVLDAQHTRKGAVRRTVRTLESVGANVIGTVMNNVKASKNPYYYSYTYK